MNDQGDLTPPTPADPTGGTGEGASVPPIEFTGGAGPVSSSAGPAASPTSWWARYRRILIPAASLALVAAGTAAVLALVLRPAATVEKMAPASDNLLVIANLDPSAAQKLNLLRAVHSFPALGNDKAISDALDQALKTSGLSFSNDIAPWLGPEVGFSGQVSVSKSTEMPVAFYLVSRDDGKAAAALAKLRSGKLGSQLSWQDQSYNGVTIAVGTPKNSVAKAAAYAYVDHVAVLASSATEIRAIIDADQGRAARLVDQAGYKATVADLPSDRVAVLYVDGRSLVQQVKKDLVTMSHLSSESPMNLADLDGFQGIGATLSANGDGLLVDMVVKVDQSKLSAATRQAMNHGGNPSAVLRWVPTGSDAFLAFGNLNQTIKSLLDQAGPGQTLAGVTDQLGITAVLPHLTGDAAVELEVGNRVIPAGAILLGTNNAASMEHFLRGVVMLATEMNGSSGLMTQPSIAPSAGFKTTRYRGVLITSYGSGAPSALASAFEPSYAVSDGMGILASNVAEVKAVIDAHFGGTTIAADPTYRTALEGALTQPSAELYVNVGSLVGALRRFSAQSGLNSVDTSALANISAVKAVILTVGSRADAMLERLFVVID